MRLTIGTWSSIDNTIYFLLERNLENNLFHQITLESVGFSAIPLPIEHKQLMIDAVERKFGYINIQIVDNTLR